MKKLFCISVILFLITALFAQSAVTADFSDSAEAYALTFFKKLNQTQTKLTYMNKKGSLAKVGTETVKGNISGTVFYDVKIKGAGALVTLRYTNYCDEAGWVFDGEIITKSNMSQNGTFTGTVKMTTPDSEKTPALEVCYDKVLLVKGAPGGGNYLVKNLTAPEAPLAQVDYSVYLKSKEDD